MEKRRVGLRQRMGLPGGRGPRDQAMLRGAKPVRVFSGVVPPPHAKSGDDKPERRFSGLLSAMTGASDYRTHHTPVSPPALWAYACEQFFAMLDGRSTGLTLRIPSAQTDPLPVSGGR